MSKTDRFRLEHISVCIEKIIKLTEILQTLESFEERWVEQDAMIRNFEILGEASKHLSNTLKDKYPEIEWAKMKGMRNFMTHQYFGIQLDTVWETAKTDIPLLKEQIITILNDLNQELE